MSEPGPHADRYERLDRRLVVATGTVVAGIVVASAVPTSIALHSDGTSWPAAVLMAVGGGVVILVLTMAGEYLRWWATRFRLTAERFELQVRLLVTTRRSLSLDRIRAVDVTASPIQRVFGLASVVIGTGTHDQSGDAEIKLHAVSRHRADELRRLLLHRAAQQGSPEVSGGPLATLNWAWAAYAPLSLLTPALAGAAVGGVLNLSSWFGVDEGTAASLVTGYVRAAALAGIVVLAVGALTVGAVGATALFVEMWWSYRLDREPGGTLRVTRGLFTTRSISIEERRLRGVEMVEPLGIRLARAARVDAVATGMRTGAGGKQADHKTLLPAAPRSVAARVAASVLREDASPISAVRLTAHPRAALGKRVRWALAPVVVVAVVLALFAVTVRSVAGSSVDQAVGGPLVALPWIFVVCAVPVALLLARDAYRNLGHGIAGRYLVARRGTVRRSTVALQRSGVIGWTVRQSIFQRRAGLVTLTATTAAGDGGYPIPDVDASEGLRFADEAVPGLLTPFLEVGAGPPG